MCDRFSRKFDDQTSCEHQISSVNLSHDSAFDRRTLLGLKIVKIFKTGKDMSEKSYRIYVTLE